MVVQHNLQAMNANRMLGITTGQQSKSAEKLSSGYRINRAADDAAGLTISEKMRKQIRGLDQASSNAEDGVSAVQTAEGALTEVHSMLQRMNELAVQASNGTNSEDDRKAIQDEIEQLTTEIDRVAETTKFNETYLLKGDAAGNKKVENLKAHDAGIKGKLTTAEDGKTAKLTIELKAGEKVNVAGTEYTIAADEDSEDAGNNKLTASKVAAKISEALKDANDIGATKSKSSVDTVTPQGTKVLTLDSDAATFQAKAAMVAYDSVKKTFTEIAANADITDLVKNANVTLYKGTGATSSATLGASNKATTGLLVVHDNDALSDGVEQQIKAGDTVTASANGLGAITGNSVAAATGYKIYEEIDLVKDTKTNAAHEASAKLNDAVGTKFNVKFEKLVEDDTEKSKTIVEGQNALNAAFGKISYTVHTAATAGKFSHDFAADSKLDIDENGIVFYDGVKIAEIEDDAAAATAGTATLALNGTATDAVYVATSPEDTYEFNIELGTTESASNLSFNLQVGADADMTNKINVDIGAMSTEQLGIKGIDVADDTGVKATYAVDAIADAISKVSSQRSALGAIQNRLEHTIANLDNVVENTTSAESRIRDVDMAEEMVEYSKNNILAQAGQSMLAQANQSTQGVLSILG